MRHPSILRFFNGILVPASAAILLATHDSTARIGETPAQCAERYGTAKTDSANQVFDKNFPLLEGAIHKTYYFQGWRIRAAFPDAFGPAIRMEFQRGSKAGQPPQLQEFEIEAILRANMVPGGSWKPVAYNNPNSPNRGVSKLVESAVLTATGVKAWRRSDGATAELRPAGMILRLELPAARQFETSVEKRKEERLRAAVPQF